MFAAVVGVAVVVVIMGEFVIVVVVAVYNKDM